MALSTEWVALKIGQSGSGGVEYSLKGANYISEKMPKGANSSSKNVLKGAIRTPKKV